jgi:MATE family multidrug resistance protein
MGFEVMAFAATALVVGTLGEVALGAHAIVLSFAALLFMIPFGISVGAGTRVGNLLGAGDTDRLGRTLRATALLASCGMLFNVAVLVLGRGVIAGAYSVDPAVVFAAKETFIVAAAFQVSDCVQVVASGVLRGMGRTQAAAVGTFVGYYVFGIPWGYYLGIVQGRGLTGLWWGLALGLTMMAVFLLGWLGYLSRSGFAKRNTHLVV